MSTESPTLQAAISKVDCERSHLRSERCAFRSFREAVRIETPDPADDIDGSVTTERVLDAFREQVMDTIDYETVYDESLAESLAEEFSQSVADALLSKQPFTQRRKRNLLVAITDAIDRRERFLAELDAERDALQAFADELSVVDAAVDKLPACSPRAQSLDRLLVVWNVYDTLEERCERLLERRQRQLREADRNVPVIDENHARNEYLYRELDSPYPVLSALAATLERIESKRDGERPTPRDRSLEC